MNVEVFYNCTWKTIQAETWAVNHIYFKVVILTLLFSNLSRLPTPWSAANRAPRPSPNNKNSCNTALPSLIPTLGPEFSRQSKSSFLINSSFSAHGFVLRSCRPYFVQLLAPEGEGWIIGEINAAHWPKSLTDRAAIMKCISESWILNLALSFAHFEISWLPCFCGIKSCLCYFNISSRSHRMHRSRELCLPSWGRPSGYI